ncbi:MAG: LLM class flavin-dependent oxidoreductase [Leptolyngbya sp. Prado105]|jgi:alkanesulfonate monooxygenase SsuD/methylene tetrahydromethanopterin reductase-like flavin-dependent oxidoreductase (luciferase family)|nr:LLM class flavin-dependent oxidoreductase [Leptolyngbya sp. Prado105]
MKTGIFCTYENYHQSVKQAIADQVALVQKAEELGFEEAWVTEHHFDEFHVSPSILMLLAHLAGVTDRIRLGSAAVLLAFHNPIQIAEEIATLDHLSQGRFAFGVARGGPFPDQNKHFATSMGDARAKTLEAMELVWKLLYESEVSFQGQFYHCDRVTLSPKPVQNPIPAWIASGDDDAIAFAAEHSFGLMGGAPFSLQKLKTTLAKYRQLNSSGSEKLILVRFFLVAETDAEAVSEALPFIDKFSRRMQEFAHRIQHSGNAQNFTQLSQQSNAFDPDFLLANSIIGSVRTCRDKVKRFQDELNVETIALQPIALDLAKNQESLTRYWQEVRSSAM